MDIMPEANLGLKSCKDEHTHTNATMMCIEVDYAFMNNHLPTPRQLFKHVIASHSAGIIKQ